MAGSHGTSRVDPLRKLLIVAILGLVVVVVYRFRVLEPGALDHTGMFALGFVVLAGYTVGQLAEVIRLPHITGYLVAGMVLGPSFVELLPESVRRGPLEHGILHAQVIPQLSLLDTLAMALIALTAGGELKIEALRNLSLIHI